MPESLLLWGGTLSYGASATSFLWPSKKSPGHSWLSYSFLVLGVSLLASALTLRWIQLGQGPFMTMYEVLLSNAFSVGFIYALIFYFIPLSRVGAVLIVPLLFMMSMWATNVPADPVPLPATFDSVWLWFHVLSGKVFLGFCLAAVSLAGLLLLDRLGLKFRPVGFENQLVNIDGLIWRFMAVAFIADSIMLVVGSVWAYDAWGRYWAWDPLETWALMTWLALGLTLHLRITFKLPLWTGWLLVLTVFILAFLTFFGVPFLSLGPHKGIM